MTDLSALVAVAEDLGIRAIRLDDDLFGCRRGLRKFYASPLAMGGSPFVTWTETVLPRYGFNGAVRRSGEVPRATLPEVETALRAWAEGRE